MKNAAIVLALLVFCISPVQSAWAKSDLGLHRLGVDVGMVDPEAVGGTLGLGGSADWGTFSPRVHMSSHLGYWSKSEDFGFGAETSIRDVSFTQRVTYHFRVSSPKFQPYVGGGIGMHFYNVEVSVPDFGGGTVTASESETKLGFDLGGGVQTPLSPKTNLYGEMWYTAADIDQFAFKVGVSFQLSK